MGAKQLGYEGETTRVENRGETTRGKHLGGKTSCYHSVYHTWLNFHKLLSVYVFSYFPFGFEGRIWDLMVI